MTRRKFLQDLETAKNSPPAHITNVERHDGDIVSFSYWFSVGRTRREVSLKLLSLNIDAYPDHNQFMLYTEDTDVDATITDSFEQIQAVIDGSSVLTALREISGSIQQALTAGLAQNPLIIQSRSKPSQDSDRDEFDIDDQFDDDDDDSSFGLDNPIAGKSLHYISNKTREKSSARQDHSMIQDLTAAKDAGFKIGVYGNLSSTGLVSVSIRIARLGISEETMAAWDMTKDQYLVLLIRFQRGYMSMVEVMEQNSLTGPVEMRVGLCTTYKPKQEQAFAAFNQADTTTRTQSAISASAHTDKATKGNLQPLFIGRPLNDLLRTRFTKIVKFRVQFKLHWGGAERLFNDRQGTVQSDLCHDIATYQKMKDHDNMRALPSIVTEDALQKCSVKASSFPLVAMQFVLRHFVRCTDFCLVCHCHLQNTFEALKPYVCSKPLCLYQFLSLGFGPAAEWEILSQPYVVDLLISFCYLQARAWRIREFPLGINLKVPVLPSFKQNKVVYQTRIPPPVISPESLPEPSPAFKAMLSTSKRVLSPASESHTSIRQFLSKGDWIVLVPTAGEMVGIYHCCVMEEQGSSFGLKIGYQRIATDSRVLSSKDTIQEIPPVEVDCYLYDHNFDDLPDQYRQCAIALLLDTIPTVSEMRNNLLQQQRESHDTNLNLLRKLSPRPAVDLLRWIIASNRSCILQVDGVTTDESTLKPGKLSEDRVGGMEEWMQFRFAQGAPDKEQRFVDCVTKKSTSLVHPTLFAWHGSPLYNWHSIIRQGLNFDEVLHGRANGHGVYMSSSLNVSMGYSGTHSMVSPGGNADWPNSELKVSAVVSLQEVVNAPQSFVAQRPHFVVAKKDWIQTRFLFVKTAAKLSSGSAPTTVYAQDPQYLARGTQEQAVSIPVRATTKSRKSGESTTLEPKVKKRKIDVLDQVFSTAADDNESVATDQDDRDFLSLLQDEDSDMIDGDTVMTDVDDVINDIVSANRVVPPFNDFRQSSVAGHANFILDKTKTDFIPGNLDTSGIRFLDPPTYASTTASTALMRAFRDTLKVQKATPLHDLGFYLDPNRVENLYQWIVEMHSFDSSLPLAQDMKAAGVTAIVFEMQFTSDFPFSPPFVRVVKPRFLDPMMGGGGHITSGGAVCMELLTSSGWSAANSIESVLLQVRLAMSEKERPARLLRVRGGFDKNPYGIGEAIAAYKRFCTKHGWKAPEGLDSLEKESLQRF